MITFLKILFFNRSFLGPLFQSIPVFVMPPEPADDAGGGKMYTYELFGSLDPALLVKPKFEDHHHEAHPIDPSLLGKKKFTLPPF